MERIDGATERVRALAELVRQIALGESAAQAADACADWVREEVVALLRLAWEDGRSVGEGRLRVELFPQPL